MATTPQAGRLRGVVPRRLAAPPAVALRTDLLTASAADLVDAGLADDEARATIAARRRGRLRTFADVEAATGLSRARLHKLAARVVPPLLEEVALVDVDIVDRPIMSERPWAIGVNFRSPYSAPAVLVSVEVEWRGLPFTLERFVSSEENAEGRLLFEVDADHVLPAGPIRVAIRLYDSNGGCDAHTQEFMVFPSNPLSLFVSPGNRSIYNGSVRPDWSAPDWKTPVDITLVNGDPGAATLSRFATWRFWDGPVGSGTVVESGTVDFGSNITVPGFGVRSAWITWTSPPGSGIHGRYESLEDMAIEVVMSRTTGGSVSGQVTCRVMAGFGINVIRVGDTTAAEDTTIANGVNDARDVFEDHGFTLSSVRWWVIQDGDVGGYEVLGSEDEWEDLLDDWTVPNASVDCFIVSGMWGGFAGYSPEPGPAGKDGDCEDDGLASTQSGICLAHELGHYIGGLCHPDDGGCSESNSLGSSNAMFSICGGDDFLYSQYRDLLDHGWVRIVR